MLPVSFLLLRRYRRAVVQSMAHRIGGAAMPPPTAAPPQPQAPPLRAPLPIITQFQEASSPDSPARILCRRLRQLPRQAAGLCAIAGACFAGLMALAYLKAAALPFFPNLDTPAPQMRLIQYRGPNSKALPQLLQAVCQAARPAPAPPRPMSSPATRFFATLRMTIRGQMTFGRASYVIRKEFLGS